MYIIFIDIYVQHISNYPFISICNYLFIAIWNKYSMAMMLFFALETIYFTHLSPSIPCAFDTIYYMLLKLWILCIWNYQFLHLNWDYLHLVFETIYSTHLKLPIESFNLNMHCNPNIYAPQACIQEFVNGGGGGQFWHFFQGLITVQFPYL